MKKSSHTLNPLQTLNGKIKLFLPYLILRFFMLKQNKHKLLKSNLPHGKLLLRLILQQTLYHPHNLSFQTLKKNSVEEDDRNRHMYYSSLMLHTLPKFKIPITLLFPPTQHHYPQVRILIP